MPWIIVINVREDCCIDTEKEGGMEGQTDDGRTDLRAAELRGGGAT